LRSLHPTKLSTPTVIREFRARRVSRFGPHRSERLHAAFFWSESENAGLILVLSVSQIIVDNSQSNHSRNMSCASSSGHNSGSRIKPLSCSWKIHSQYLSMRSGRSSGKSTTSTSIDAWLFSQFPEIRPWPVVVHRVGPNGCMAASAERSGRRGRLCEGNGQTRGIAPSRSGTVMTDAADPGRAINGAKRPASSLV
jgi:hypothetical protein